MKSCLKAVRLDILSMGIPWLCFMIVYSTLFTMIFIFIDFISFPYMCAGTQVMAMFASYSPFLFQERDKITLLYGTLPLTMKEIVRGRYAYMIFISGLFFIKDLLIYTGVVFAKGSSLNFMTIVQGLALSLILMALNSTIVPPLYKHGLMKGMVHFAVQFFVLIVGFGLLVGTEALSRLLSFWYSYQTVFLFGTILISSIILYLSYRIAIVSYRNRSWI